MYVYMYRDIPLETSNEASVHTFPGNIIIIRAIKAIRAIRAIQRLLEFH